MISIYIYTLIHTRFVLQDVLSLANRFTPPTPLADATCSHHAISGGLHPEDPSHVWGASYNLKLTQAGRSHLPALVSCPGLGKRWLFAKVFGRQAVLIPCGDHGMDGSATAVTATDVFSELYAEVLKRPAELPLQLELHAASPLDFAAAPGPAPLAVLDPQQELPIKRRPKPKAGEVPAIAAPAAAAAEAAAAELDLEQELEAIIMEADDSNDQDAEESDESEADEHRSDDAADRDAIARARAEDEHRCAAVARNVRMEEISKTIT